MIWTTYISLPSIIYPENNLEFDASIYTLDANTNKCTPVEKNLSKNMKGNVTYRLILKWFTYVFHK